MEKGIIVDEEFLLKGASTVHIVLELMCNHACICVSPLSY